MEQPRLARDGVALYLYMNGKRVQSVARRWEDIEPLIQQLLKTT